MRAALTAGDGIDVELRVCYYRNPMFCGTLFSESVRQRFAGQDVREVSRFMARLRSNWTRAGPGFPHREAEAVIRGVLGEMALLEHVHPGRAGSAAAWAGGRCRAFWHPRGDPQFHRLAGDMAGRLSLAG